MTETASIKKSKEQTGLLTNEKFPLSGRSLHLSAEVKENELLCCLLDKHNNTYIAFEKISVVQQKLDEEIFKNEILSAKASGISIAFAPGSFILVPAPFFKKESLKDYLSSQQLDKIGETPCFDYIKNLDSYNLYTVNTEALHLLQKHYPSAVFRHNSSIFIEYVLTENKHAEGSNIFVSVYSSYFDIAVLKSGKLVLSNRFYYSNTSDFIYHLLWVYEQLGLDNEKTPCTFYGDTNSSSESFKLSGQYIKHTVMGKKNSQLAASPALALLPGHKYRSLFTQYLCV